MSTVAEISDAFRRLPTEDRWNLLHELSEELWRAWDQQIERDLGEGRLESFISQARADIAASRTFHLNII